MKFSVYFRSRLIPVCCLGTAVIYFAAVMFWTNALPCVIAASVCGAVIIAAAWLFFEWRSVNKKYEALQRKLSAMDKPYLMGAVMDVPFSPMEQKYYDVIRAVSSSAIGAVENAEKEKDEYRDYVESWVHEIKTPLAACSLIIDNGGDVRKLKRELKRADNMTETILYYARLRSIEKDVKIKRASVREIVDDAVKSQMEILVAAGISIEVSGDFEVDTDPKLVTFIIRQILMNAAKYCPKCEIVITAEDGRLTIGDNGPGIPSYELPRVRERGFTGEKWRGANSTGMGLYIADSLCAQLGIDLEIDSEAGHGTTFLFDF